MVFRWCLSSSVFSRSQGSGWPVAIFSNGFGCLGPQCLGPEARPFARAQVLQLVFQWCPVGAAACPAAWLPGLDTGLSPVLQEGQESRRQPTSSTSSSTSCSNSSSSTSSTSSTTRCSACRHQVHSPRQDLHFQDRPELPREPRVPLHSGEAEGDGQGAVPVLRPEQQ